MSLFHFKQSTFCIGKCFALLIHFPVAACIPFSAVLPAQAGFAITPESQLLQANIEAADLLSHLVCETLHFTKGDVKAARETITAFVGRWMDQGLTDANNKQRALFFQQLFVGCKAPGSSELLE